MGYFRDSIRGLSWMGSFRVVSRGIAFLRIAILARLLLPSHFGIYGIASMVLTLLETLTTTGVNVYLIQEEKNLRDYVDTAWVISIVRGIIIALIIIIFTPLVMLFFNAPEAKNLLYLVAMVALIRGFINPSRVRFQKDLKFHREFWFSGAVLLVDFSVVVISAFILRSPVSLVWGLVAGAILEVILSFVFIKPRPKLFFEVSKAKEIVGRGKWVTASSIFSYLFKQGDDMVVGRMLDTTALGNYQVAYRISTLPLTEVTQVTNRVTFPVYSKISGDRRRLKKAFIKTFTGIFILVSILGLILFIFPRYVVYLILGENWYQIVPVLRVLSIFGVIRAITNSTIPLFNACKKQEYITIITLVSVIALAVTIIPLVVRMGLIGAGISVLLGSIVSLVICFYFIVRIFK